MRYFKMYKDGNAVKEEISKEEARHILDGWWKAEALDEIFGQEKGFRLYTPYTEVWTMTAEGMVPMAGFYGTVG